MRMSRYFTLAGAVALVAVSASSLVAVAQSPDASDGAPAAADQLVFGVSLDSLFPGRQAEMTGLQARADELGIQLIVSNADGDAQQQNSQMQSLVNQGVDGILLVAVDQSAIASATNGASSAGIPVVTFDRALPDNTAVAFHTGLDSLADGKSCGAFMASKADGQPHKVLELLGALNDQNAIDRSAGFEESLDASTNNLEIIKAPTDWNADQALSATENALQANPDIWGIFIPSDFMMSSIDTALSGADRLVAVGEPSHVISCAIDGSAPGYEATVAGTNDAVVVLQLGDVGAGAIDALNAVVTGSPTDGLQSAFPGTLYTHDDIEANADKIWGAQG